MLEKTISNTIIKWANLIEVYIDKITLTEN